MFRGRIYTQSDAHQIELFDTDTNRREWTITTYNNEAIGFWGWDGAGNQNVKMVVDTGGVGSTSNGGDVYARAYYYTSDRVLKTNIKPITGALDKVLQLNGVSFDWKATGEAGIGFIAQDVEKIFPEFVDSDSITGLKSINYGNLTTPIVEAIKEQQGQIEALQAEIAELKADRESGPSGFCPAW